MSKFGDRHDEGDDSARRDRIGSQDGKDDTSRRQDDRGHSRRERDDIRDRRNRDDSKGRGHSRPDRDDGRNRQGRDDSMGRGHSRRDDSRDRRNRDHSMRHSRRERDESWDRDRRGHTRCGRDDRLRRDHRNRSNANLDKRNDSRTRRSNSRVSREEKKLPYSSSSSESPVRKSVFRFDSPPREAARIVNLHGLEGAPLQGLRAMKAAEQAHKSYMSEQSKLAKEIYIGNVPPHMPIGTLIARLNELLVSIGASTLAGSPIVSGWLGGEGQFAFLEFRTAEEANNALALNGHSLDGCVLKVGRPRGSAAIADAPSVPTGGISSVFALDHNVASLGSLEESVKTEPLVLVGAPPNVTMDDLVPIVDKFGPLATTVLINSCLLFEFEQVTDQRKCAYESLSSVGLRFDRDHCLALLRVDEAVSAGFIDIPNEQISKGIHDLLTTLPTRTVWMTNFPPVDPKELEAELQSECVKFGTVVSITLTRVNKDLITVDHGYTCSAESQELVAVIEFASVASAIKCRKFITGGSCFFLPDNSLFEPAKCHIDNNPTYINKIDVSETDAQLPEIKRGKVVSAQEGIIAANKRNKKIRIAPEDREILD